MGIMFAVSFLYYAPFIIVGQFGFNFYMNGVLLDVAELITYFITVTYITQIRRKKLFYLTMSITFACSCILLLLNQGNTVCTGSNCWNANQIVSLGVMFILKLVGAIQFIVISVYINELYPTQIAAIGLGINCFVLCLPGIFIPSLVSLLNSLNIPVMSVFILMAVVFMGIIAPMK